MNNSVKHFIYFFIACIAFLSINGCTSSKFVNENKECILKSHTAITISSEEFNKLESPYNGPKQYCGMGLLGKFRGYGIGVVEPVFNKILYDPVDSTLFVEGVVYDYFSKEPIQNAQIIMGILPQVKKDTSFVKIDIIGNYLIRKKGKFSTAFDLRSDYQLIFATGDNYSEDGEYMGAWTSSIKAYDIYKLNGLYRNGIK